MVSFLRRLRLSLSRDGRTGAYLLYALGEISLIVIGILVAIQLNAAAEARDDARLEKRYVSYLINDLGADVGRLSAVIDYWGEKKAGLELAKDFHYGDFEPENKKQFLLDVSRGARGSRGRLTAGSPTFEELLSTGGLGVIKDERIRVAVLGFYKRKEQVEVYADNARTDYGFFLNGVFSFKSPSPDDIDDRDVPVALDQFRRQEFLALINQELTFAYSLERSIQRTKSEAESLQSRLAAYLSEL